MTTTGQRDSIEAVVTAVQQRWGVKALRRLGEVTPRTDGIPTGHTVLDGLLGGDGLRRGAVTCISGAPTCGKTALALDLLARVQTAGEVTVYVDTSGALDPEDAESRGIDLERLLIVWPQPAALGLDIARDIVARDGAGLIVFDASDCTGPAMGVQRTLRQLSVAVRRSPYAVLCLAADPSTRFGGALLSRADVHLRADRQRWQFAADGTLEGYTTRLTVAASRYGQVGQSATIPITLHPQRPTS